MMIKQKDAIKSALEQLVKDGRSILYAEAYKKNKLNEEQKELVEKNIGSQIKEHHLNRDYQKWYTAALPVVKQVLPDRYADFVDQYQVKNRKEINYSTYVIAGYLHGLVVTNGGQKSFDNLWHSIDAWKIK